MKQCALHAVAASLVRESGELHGARANAGFDVPLEDACLDGVSGNLQVDAGALPSRCVGQRDSDQAADVEGEFHETERLHMVSENLVASASVAETDRLHTVSENLIASAVVAESDLLLAVTESLAVPGASGHSAWRSRVRGLRLRREAHRRSGSFVEAASA